MKKWFKYLLRTILFIVFLLLIVLFSAYIPFVQRYALGKAVKYVERSMGIKAEIGHFSLKFPLRLELERVFAGRNDTDTLLYIGHLEVKVGVSGIWKKTLSVPDFSLQGACFYRKDTLVGGDLRARIEALDMKIPYVGLAEKRVNIATLLVKGGNVLLLTGQKDLPEDAVGRKTLDWVIDVWHLELDSVRYAMSTASLPYLTANIGRGDVTNVSVDLPGQWVCLDSIGLSSGVCRMITSPSSGNTTQKTGQERDTTGMWIIEAKAATLADYAFSMSTENRVGLEWNLYRMGVRLRHIYNRGSVLRASLRDLQLLSREGGEIETMRADIRMEEGKSELAGGYLRTPNSIVHLNALSKDTLKIKLDASVGMKDIALFWWQDMPEQMKKEKLNVMAVADYHSGQWNMARLSLDMPGSFRLEGGGVISSLHDLKALAGDFSLRGEINTPSWTAEFLPEKMALPSRLALSLDVKAEKGVIMPEFHLFEKEGCIHVGGNFNLSENKYSAYFQADSFSLASLLPADSLGSFMATAEIKGQGVRWTRANAQMTMYIRALEYKRYLYSGIRLAGKLAEARLEADLVSEDENLQLDFKIQADSSDGRYSFRVAGDVGKAELHNLHLYPDKLGISFRTDIQGAFIPDEYYRLQANINRFCIDNNQGMQHLGKAAITLDSRMNATQLDVSSGDFRLSFQGDTLVTRLSSMFTDVVAAGRKQIACRHLEIEHLKELLPRFHLELKGHADNIIGKYLRAKKIVFDELSLQIGASPEKGLNTAVGIIRPQIGAIVLDSVFLHLQQETGEIEYDAEITSHDGAMKDLYRIGISGEIIRDELRLLLHQQNQEQETGINVGAALTLGDSSVSIHFFPASPVLGYSSWTLNENNEIRLYGNHRIDADLRLESAGKLFSLQSGEKNGEREQLDIAINGIDLSALSRSIPFVPDLSGRLDIDAAFTPDSGHFEATGKLNISDFYLEEKRIGDIGLDINRYCMDQSIFRQTWDIALYLDSVKRVSAQGAYSASVARRDFQLKLNLLSFPLSLVNLFLPDNTVTAYGELQGQVEAGGMGDTLSLDGRLAFRRGGIEADMLGTRYNLDTTLIPIQRGIIRLEDFGLTAPNKKRLGITGGISLLPLESMKCDLRLGAKNFQIVNVKKNPTSSLYGKAYIDLEVALKGLFRALHLSGSAALLNSTALTYVLRNSAPELKENAQNLVRFVSFADTTLADKDELTNRINTGSFSMKLLVEIGEAVSINVNLSEDGNNQVAIQGGGNLIYTMNPESGNGLVGKYVLNGGTVRYGIPVVGEKNFTIQGSSYLEWTGNLQEPMLHITAATAVRVNVTEDNQTSRIVNFEVLIRINGDLQRPQITFDLTAPSDQAIQTQLAAFSAEERTKQAMNLLIYGTYTAPGTVNNNANATNTLNNFVEKELNQWTRKYLKNTNLTFGIDTYNQIGTDGQEIKRTDYSYQFSKQLFNDKINVKVGGRISSDNDPGTSMEDNLIDDIAIEYLFTKNRNLFLKVFRHTNYESVLEGEVTQTGIGIVWRKSFRKLKEIFKKKKGGT